jgi:TetR/AcrR family transcriptional repressor of nem operon
MSQQINAPDKRQHLVATAAELIHHRGFLKTTLADISAQAEIPLGSIYYYFRSREDIARAVMERRVEVLKSFLERQAAKKNPRLRLEAFVQIWVDDRESDTEFGCPIGSLCYELAKGRGPMSAEAAQPFHLLLAWCEAQFRQMGRTRDAKTLALHLIAALQGISLIANALGDSKKILRETAFLKRWLREVDGSE